MLWIYIKHKEKGMFICVVKLCRPVLICWKLWSHLIFELLVKLSTASEAMHVASLYVISAYLAQLFVVLVQARIGFQVSNAVKEWRCYDLLDSQSIRLFDAEHLFD